MSTEYSTVRKAVAAGISAGYENSISSQWSVWLGFCTGIGLDNTSLGGSDPHHNKHGRIDFRIYRQLRSYTREDPPPARVKPLPTSVIQHVYDRCIAGNDCEQCVADLIWVAFYFLMRPGEYCDAGNDDTSTPFRLCDVVFRNNSNQYDAINTKLNILETCNHVALTFTEQKNGVKGECIGHRASEHATACPVRRIPHRVAYLRCRSAPTDIPLASYHDGMQWKTVKSAHFTQEIKASIATIGTTVGLHPTDVSARSLCASGAMALLIGGVDDDVIQLIGRWRSDEMLRYLHVTARSLTHNHARIMFGAGEYELLAPAAGSPPQFKGI